MTRRIIEDHVQQTVIAPLEDLARRAREVIGPVVDILNRMTPVDSVTCLGQLRKFSRDLQDADRCLRAAVEFQEKRIFWMKEAKRKAKQP